MDCYFTCEGLRVDGNIQTIKDIADNFAYLIYSSYQMLT
ncbi:alpha,alpha-trehalase [Francisella persica]